MSRLRRVSQTDKEQPSLFFDQWSEGQEVKDDDGQSMPVYHGTTHAFDSFDNNHAKGNAEGYFGRAHYFTNNPNDASFNYADHSGPDLSSRYQLRVKRLENDLLYGDLERTKELGLLNAHGEPDVDRIGEYAKVQARTELMGASPNVIPAYLKMKNPANISRWDSTRYEGTYTNLDEDGSLTDDSELEGPAAEVANSIRWVAKKYDVDGEALLGELEANIGFPGDGDGDWTAYSLNKALRGSPLLYDLHDDDGNNASSEFIRDVFADMGHDGAIMNAYEAFGPSRGGLASPHIAPDTKHYITWNGSSVKSSIGNNGLYDPSDARITAANKFKRVARMLTRKDLEEFARDNPRSSDDQEGEAAVARVRKHFKKEHGITGVIAGRTQGHPQIKVTSNRTLKMSEKEDIRHYARPARVDFAEEVERKRKADAKESISASFLGHHSICEVRLRDKIMIVSERPLNASVRFAITKIAEPFVAEFQISGVGA